MEVRLNRGTVVEATPEHGETLFQGGRQTLRSLKFCSPKSDLSNQQDTGTPLHEAVSANEPAIVKLLLEHKAT